MADALYPTPPQNIPASDDPAGNITRFVSSQNTPIPEVSPQMRDLNDLALSQIAFGGKALTRNKNSESLWFPDDLRTGAPNHIMSFTIKQTIGQGTQVLDTLTQALAGNGLPTELSQSFTQAGIDLARNATLQTLNGATTVLKNLAQFFNIQSMQGGTFSGGTIALPVPANLQTAYNIQYDTPELGMAGQAIKPFDRNMYGIQGMDNGTTGQNIAQSALGVAATFGGAESLLSNPLARGALKVGFGIAVNPQKIVLLHGVNFRRHQFTYRLSPRNLDESRRINKIIQKFKYHAHPGLAGGPLFFRYPEFFEITTNSNYTFNIGPSVLETITVDYHGQGFPAYHRDKNENEGNAPAEVILSLSFLETEILTKERLSEEPGGNRY